MSDLNNLRKDLRSFRRPGKAKILMRFFKTRPGEYGEEDKFLGLMTAETRSVAQKYSDPPLNFITKLLASKIHEERVVAVMILTRQFKGSDLKGKKKIYDFYFKNIKGINNWDLVDGSAPTIVGDYLSLSNSPRDILYKLVKSKSLWERRIGIMATFCFIKNKDFSDALKISEMLLDDKEDLIHKAVGWMLREIGNRDIKAEEGFLKKFYKKMPRTMLRYAIEKFPEAKRQSYLKR